MKSILRLAVLPVLLLTACEGIIGSATEDLTAPRPDAAAPTSLTAASSVDTVAIDLTWVGDENATAYRVYRAEDQAALSPAALSPKRAGRKPAYKPLAEVAAQPLATVKTLTYNDTAVKAGVTYHYRVRAVSASGRESDPSNLASAKPGPVGPAPTAAPILAAINEAATTQVEHNDPREKITHTYVIKTNPAHGTATISATGLVTFTPALDYEGKDSMSVTVTASDKRAGDVTIPIVVGNRAPSPVAPGITLLANSTGSSQVLAGDPDKTDTHTFAIVLNPEAGDATIDGSGLVSYVPPVNWTGQTRIEVLVTDNKGADGRATIFVNVGAPLPQNGPALPGFYCGDGSNHVMLTSISMPINTVLTPDTDYTVTAEISYAVVSPLNVGLQVGAYTHYETLDGCGTMTATVSFNTGASTNLGIWARAGGDSQFNGRYLVAANPLDMPFINIDSTDFPEYDGYLLDNIQYEWSATITYNPNRSSGIWSTFLEIDEIYGQGNWYPYFAPINVQDTTRTVLLRSMPSCGDDHINFEIYFSNDTSPNMSQLLSVPIAPPVMETYDFYVNYPLLDQDQTVEIYLSDCTGLNPTVQLRPSAPFFSVDQETVTLPASVNLTYHADQVQVGSLEEGVLEIISETGAFSTKTLPVSARRFDYNLADWTWAGCTLDCSSDDGERTIPLPFNFPYAGTYTTTIYANTNGALHFDDANGNMDDYGNLDGSFNDLDPTYFGSPFVAFFWTDNRVGYNWNYADTRQDYNPGVYYRDMGTHVEILYWDHFSYSAYTNRQVFLHRIYPNGQIQLTYPMINPTGVESVIAYSGTGRAVQTWNVWNIQNGAVLNVPMLPAE